MLVLKLEVVGGTDKTVRFGVQVEDMEAGELQMDREAFTKFADLLFGENYQIKKIENENKNRVG